MASLGWLPSMFASMSRSQRKTEVKPGVRNAQPEIETKFFIEKQKCICGNGLVFMPTNLIGRCKCCNREYSWEYLKYKSRQVAE